MTPSVVSTLTSYRRRNSCRWLSSVQSKESLWNSKLLRNGVREHWAWRHRQGGQRLCKFRDILLNFMILIKNPKPRKSSENWTKIGIGGSHSQTKLLVNGISYFEIETQLLTFRKDILPYEFAYHLILQNRNGNRKVKGGNGV